MINEELERLIIRLIAEDRTEIPISSMSGKLKRIKPKTAQEIRELILPNNSYKGERVYAKIREENTEKARTMKEAIAEFIEEYPRYGKILEGIIAKKRVERETDLYFGVNESRILTKEDYIDVIIDLGFSKTTAEKLYPELIEISRKLSEKRGNPERSILVGKIYNESSEE